MTDETKKTDTLNQENQQQNKDSGKKDQDKKGKSKDKKVKPILTEDELKKKRARKTRVAVASFILLLGVGVMGNWYYNNSDISSTIEPIVKSSQTKTLGEAEYVDATTRAVTENEYFSSARVNRQTARDSALEKLQKVVDSENESSEAKQQATEKIAEISGYISTENKIETLVTAKGVENCIAVINEDGTRVDIIVDTKELTDELIMQIKEIAIQQLGCSFENVSIIQSK